VGGFLNVSPTTAITTAATAGGFQANNGGYGTIATINGVGTHPRQGQIVGRFTF
jgi:hypothetical protein